MAQGLKRWQVYPSHADLALKLGHHLERDPIIAQLLLNRNIRSLKDAQRFLQPQCSFEDHFDSALLKDIEQIIENAIQQGQRIIVYGDYDVDGTTAVSLVYLYLKSLQAEVSYYVPDRNKEGYGVSEAGIQYAITNGFTLVSCVYVWLDTGDKGPPGVLGAD